MRVLPLLGLALLGASAPAQLVFGNGAYSSSNPGASGAYYLDLGTSRARQLWTGAGNKKVTAITGDGATLWSADNARLNRWSYGDVGTPPDFVNGFYRLGSNGTVYATFVGGLASVGASVGTGANAGIYGYTNFNGLGSALFVEDGIYRVNTDETVRGVPNMTLVWRHDDLAYNLKGLAFDAASGLFYATNVPGAGSTAPAGAGIFTVDAFGTGAVRKVADFDPFLPAPDGLAIGGGRLWLSGKASGETTLKILGYNLATGGYDEAFALDGYSTSAQATSLAWAPGAAVPEPASLAALSLGALALLRRRRS